MNGILICPREVIKAGLVLLLYIRLSNELRSQSGEMSTSPAYASSVDVNKKFIAERASRAIFCGSSLLSSLFNGRRHESMIA